MNNSDFISIIIPTFNRVDLLRETLDSIRSQSHENWECIVIDDHSSDNTLEVLKAYHSIDSRILYYKNNRSKGAPGARNTGIEKANGQFIFFFDSDNLMKPNALKELLKGFEYKEVDICTCHAEVVDDSLNTIGSFNWNCFGNINEQLISGNTYVDYNTALISKTAIDRFGFTDENCPAFQEWDTHILLSKFCNYFTIEKQLIQYRKSEKDTISSNIFQSTKGFLFILSKHKASFLKYPVQFKKHGLNLLKNVQQTENSQYVSEVKKELKILIPGFQQHIISSQLLTIVQKIQDKLKKHLSRKQKGF